GPTTSGVAARNRTGNGRAGRAAPFRDAAHWEVAARGRRSMFPFREMPDECAEPVRLRAEALQGLDSIAHRLVEEFPGVREPAPGDDGRFALRHVLACGLAERGRGRCDVED